MAVKKGWFTMDAPLSSTGMFGVTGRSFQRNVAVIVSALGLVFCTHQVPPATLQELVFCAPQVPPATLLELVFCKKTTSRPFTITAMIHQVPPATLLELVFCDADGSGDGVLVEDEEGVVFDGFEVGHMFFRPGITVERDVTWFTGGHIS